MAETKKIMLAKSMQKHAGRAKEKILQNLGKVDRTADEIFDDHLNNFNRQQANANRLQKEFNNYIRCIRAAQVASKSLMDAICEIYEPQWSGYDALQAQTAASESLWLDFAHKLGDQVLIPLNTYTGQFPEMKKKVDKRNRKLIDYDGQRHSFQNLQANANKRKDDAKLTKGREQLEEARRTYEILNTELHDELPALYDSRILFLVTNLQTLFATEQVFHNETAKIYSELEAIVDKLATESQRGSNTLRKQTTNAIKASSPVQSPVKQMNNANINNSNYQNQITTNGASNANSPTSTTSSQLQQEQEAQQLNFETTGSLSSISSTPESPPANQKANSNTNAVISSVPTTPNNENAMATTTLTPKQPSYQDLSAVVKTEIAATSNDSTTMNSNSNGEQKTTVTQAQQQTATKSDDEAMNSFEKTENSTNTTTAIATTRVAKNKNITSQEQEEISTEQLNGNSIGDGNKNATQPEKMSSSTADSTPSRATPSNNGNNEDNNKKAASGGKISMKRKLKLNSSIPFDKKGINKSSQLVVVGKNPFEEEEDDTTNNIYEAPTDATTTDLPPGVLYRVKATYGYVKEDVDELSFEIGDIIRVIEYDDPEDQEEGWLMGQKEGTNEKGLFPANFTRPI